MIDVFVMYNWCDWLVKRYNHTITFTSPSHDSWTNFVWNGNGNGNITLKQINERFGILQNRSGGRWKFTVIDLLKVKRICIHCNYMIGRIINTNLYIDAFMFQHNSRFTFNKSNGTNISYSFQLLLLLVLLCFFLMKNNIDSIQPSNRESQQKKGQ